MSKKDKIKTIEVDDVNLVPELLDDNHRVIPIVTGGDEPVEEVEVPEIIPILTLRSSVLFPGAITPITVGRDKSINLVRAVNAEGGILDVAFALQHGAQDAAFGIHGTYEADALVASHGDRGDRTGKEHRTAQRKDRDDFRHFDLLGDLVAAGHDRNHVVFAVEQLGKQARIFDFDGFDYLIFFTHSLQIQIYNGAKVTIFYRYLFYL